jgi:hypothetical protein
MRFLVANHLRLGAAPGGFPEHFPSDSQTFSTRVAWSRAVAQAIERGVHALFLTGEIVSTTNPGLEPLGPLADGIAQLREANIPIVVVSDGRFTPSVARHLHVGDSVHFLDDLLDWTPAITTHREAVDGPGIHVVAASLAESTDVPVNNPITLEEMDRPGSIWILTDALQPDDIRSDHALVIEPGSIAPLAPSEIGTHGAWLVDTDAMEAELLPLANLEFAAIAIDVSDAHNVEDVERIIAQAVIAAAENVPSASHLVVHCTLTGATHVYAALADIATDLQRTLSLEHQGVTIAISGIDIEATPLIDLEPLIGRPDPVGEIARLLHALSSSSDLTEAHTQLLDAVEQKLLAVTHARVFGSIVDAPLADAHTLLQRSAWAALDTMVRQRGID